MNHNIYDKSRNGLRGAKKRQAIVRSEINIRSEKNCEKICLGLCENLSLNIEEYFDANDRWPWQTAYKNILNKVLTRNGITYLGPVLRLKI